MKNRYQANIGEWLTQTYCRITVNFSFALLREVSSGLATACEVHFSLLSNIYPRFLSWHSFCFAACIGSLLSTLIRLKHFERRARQFVLLAYLMSLNMTLFELKTKIWLIASFQRYWRSESVQSVSHTCCVGHAFNSLWTPISLEGSYQ